MGEVLLNGRPATDFEVAAVERARERERGRDLELLAGVLAKESCPVTPAQRLLWDMA